MPTVNILTVGTRGVDLRSNPLGLGNQRLHSAVNMVFEEGVVKTRPGLIYHDLGVSGQFQGACAYAPSMGISAESFGPALSALVVAAAGRVFAIDTTGGEFGCTPQEITCDGMEARCRGEVNLYQAENYLIGQNPAAGTFWWTGDGRMVASPGLADDQYWEDPEPPKVEYVFAPPEAQNACCDTFTCYDPGGNSAPSCSGSFPDTARPPMGIDGGGSGSFAASSSSGGGGDVGSSSSSRSSASSSSSRSSASSSGSTTSSSGSTTSSSGSVSSTSGICSFAIIDVVYGGTDDVMIITVSNTGTLPLEITGITGIAPLVPDAPLPIFLLNGSSIAITVEATGTDLRGTTFTVATTCGSQSSTFPVG